MINHNTGAYFNIGPPSIAYIVDNRTERISDYEHFSLKQFAESVFGTTDKRRFLRAVKDYAVQHKDEIISCPVPQAFMIAERDNGQKTIDKNQGDIVCLDVVRTIAILGRVSGNIYIPQRPIIITKDIIKNDYHFLISESKP